VGKREGKRPLGRPSSKAIDEVFLNNGGKPLKTPFLFFDQDSNQAPPY